MPSRIRFACASWKKEISVEYAEAHSETRPYNPLTCIGKGCKAGLEFVSSGSRTRRGKKEDIGPYFRLRKGQKHATSCLFNNLSAIVRIIADKAPPGLLRVDGDPFLRFRLMAARQAFTDFEANLARVPSNAPDDFARAEYEWSGALLDPYLSSAKKILRLRALIIEADMRKTLELTYGKRKFSWGNFYFEKNRYDRCFENLQKKYRGMPVAIEGIVSFAGTYTRDKDHHTFGMLRLEPLEFPDPRDARITLSFAPAIWSTGTQAFTEYEKGQKVLAYGLWTARDGSLDANTGSRRKFYLNLTYLRVNQVSVFSSDVLSD